MKNIVIVGGGSAGWLTSVYVRSLFPKANITTIESSEIGILGAGEGSVPTFPLMLNSLGIDENDFIKKTKATFKLGISFENWKGDGEKFFHPFSATSMHLLYTQYTTKAPIAVGFPDLGGIYYISNAVANGEDLNEVIPSNKLAYGNKAPLFKVPNYGNIMQKEEKVEQSVAYSYHFDARLVADYLRDVAVSRGVTAIDQKILDFNQKENGDIESINLENGEVIPCDFIFDCSGFARLLIGKKYNTPWIDYSEQLKVNSAIPFFLPQDTEKITPYTHAVAMKYGWMWKIPLQHRYGCGYIFDDNYITAEEAKKEVEEMLGHPIENNRTIKFKAGRYEKVWVNNCIAIGLSTGFTEPIEATSLWIAMIQLLCLDVVSITKQDEILVNEYNSLISAVNTDILEFLYFHYYTTRNDTDFWRDYEATTVMPEKLKKKIKLWESRAPKSIDRTIDSYYTNLWGLEGWILVGLGNGRIDPSVYKEDSDLYELDDKLSQMKNNLRNNLKKIFEYSIDHKTFLDNLE
jgi:tryptophan halogenase